VNCVIPYILRLCRLYWYVMTMMFGGSLPALYSTWDKVTYLRNLILANYNCCIRGGYDIYSNQLCFLDHKVVLACSAQFAKHFGDPRGPFWRVGPPCLARPMWSHEGIHVYTPTLVDHTDLPRHSRATQSKKFQEYMAFGQVVLRSLVNHHDTLC
jgi:hypothetical protein